MTGERDTFMPAPVETGPKMDLPARPRWSRFSKADVERMARARAAAAEALAPAATE